jgi:hypothetical protein
MRKILWNVTFDKSSQIISDYAIFELTGQAALFKIMRYILFLNLFYSVVSTAFNLV